MKKKVLFIISIVTIFTFVIFGDKLLLTNNDVDDGFNDLSQIKHVNTLSMMLEQNSGAGDYELETRSSWPTKDDGYVFNETLSKCENGSKLSWDEENNTVVMASTTSDKCYVYFDVFIPTLVDVCGNGDNLANCVKTFATTYSSDKTNIYYHNSSLTNGAGDNSYRYAGASDTTNNFVCFGSDATTCPDDNLYRIIGVFGNQVKLIKWDYATTALLGTNGDYENTYQGVSSGYWGTSKGTNLQTAIGAYWWNKNTNNNTWSESELNTVNLNTNFLTNIGSAWASKIATTTWKVGGNTWANVGRAPAATAYTNEYVNPAETITETKKIGLMYVSDYGFAAAPSAWTTNLSSYSNSSITSVNWMYMGLNEWTVVRQSDNTDYVFYVYTFGYVYYNDRFNDLAFAVRPVFYLNSDVVYNTGTGAKNDPIRIKID